MQINKSKYFSVSELSELQLLGYPLTRQGWNELVKRDKWEFREVKGHGGPGGIRREYVPPPEIVTLIEARQRQIALDVFRRNFKSFTAAAPQEPFSESTANFVDLYNNGEDFFNTPEWLRKRIPKLELHEFQNWISNKKHKSEPAQQSENALYWEMKLDELKRRVSVESDEEISAWLGISRQTLHAARSGEAPLPNSAKSKIMNRVGYFGAQDALFNLLPPKIRKRLTEMDNEFVRKKIKSAADAEFKALGNELHKLYKNGWSNDELIVLVEEILANQNHQKDLS